MVIFNFQPIDSQGGEETMIYVDIGNTTGIEDGSQNNAYSKIQSAVDVAGEGATIEIRAGAYNENVIINKSLTLRGEGKDTTIIDGGGSGNVIYITANHVTISGLKVTNGDNGIYLIPNWSIHNITIRDVIITSNAKIAFSAPHSGGSHIIEDCVISNNGSGSYAHQFRNSIIQNCEVFGNGSGLGVAWGSGTLITGNKVHHNAGPGISLDSMNNSIVEKNEVHDNKIGIHIAYVGRNNIIRENLFAHNNLGINMGEQYVRSNKIYHNDIIENTVQGNDRQNDNIWDDGYPSGGNFWSDYTGIDDGSGGRNAGDGIGDTKIPHLGMDSYPLMKPWNIDTTPPEPPALDQTTTPIKITPTTVTGMAEPKATAQVFVNGEVQGSASIDESGKFSMNNVNLNEGTNSITAKAIDTASNVSKESEPVTVVLDTKPPAPPVLNQLKPITNQTPIMVTGAVEPNSKIEIFVNDASAGTTTADSSGIFGLDIELNVGVNLITARATDAAKNTSKSSPPLPVLYELFPQDPLAYLPIIDIEGIGNVFAERLKREGIEIIRDIAIIDVQTLQTLTEKVEIPIFGLYVIDRKAELVLSIKVDGEMFEPLLEKNLEEIMIMPVDELSKLTNQPADVIHSLKMGISTLLLALDNEIVKNMLLGDLVVGPYLKLDNYELMEKVFEIDEKASVNLTVKNLGSTVARNVKGVVTSDFEKLKVLSGEIDFGDISKGSVVSAKVDLQTLNIEPAKYTLKLGLDAKGVQPVIQGFEVNVVED